MKITFEKTVCCTMGVLLVSVVLGYVWMMGYGVHRLLTTQPARQEATPFLKVVKDPATGIEYLSDQRGGLVKREVQP